MITSNNRYHPTRSPYYCLFVPYTVYIWVFFFAHIPFTVNCTFNTTSTERLQKHPFFLQRTAPFPDSFCEGCIWHDLHIIMVTAPFNCNRKAQVASVQSFTLWQQPTTEIITWRDHSLFVCSTFEYMCYSSCTSSRSWWIVYYSTQRQPRGCNNTLGLMHGLCHMT